MSRKSILIILIVFSILFIVLTAIGMSRRTKGCIDVTPSVEREKLVVDLITDLRTDRDKLYDALTSPYETTMFGCKVVDKYIRVVESSGGVITHYFVSVSFLSSSLVSLSDDYKHRSLTINIDVPQYIYDSTEIGYCTLSFEKLFGE